MSTTITTTVQDNTTNKNLLVGNHAEEAVWTVINDILWEDQSINQDRFGSEVKAINIENKTDPHAEGPYTATGYIKLFDANKTKHRFTATATKIKGAVKVELTTAAKALVV